MSVYHGVVRGKMVVLGEEVDLADGAEVEVRVIQPEQDPESERERERAFQHYLLRTGRIRHLPTYEPDPPGTDRTLAPILSGPLVSQTIIEERR